jgi:hypothetical protein
VAWVPTITVAGIVSWQSQVTVITATPPVAVGAAGVIWTFSISNVGIVTMTSGAAGTQFHAVLSDPNTRRWYAYADAIGVISWLTREWSNQPIPQGA